LVRWLVESRGWKVFWHFHQSRSVQAALGAPVAEVDGTWLGHLARQEQMPKPCRDALAQNVPRFRVGCQHVEPSRSATPPAVPLLPSDIRIVPPEAAVPQPLAALSGKWSGVWDGILPHILVVEAITPPRCAHLYLGQRTPVAGRVGGLGPSAGRICGWGAETLAATPGHGPLSPATRGDA
jgi:hypothetical protein